MENWKKNLYAIWIAEFLAVVGFSTSYPILPFYLQELGVKDPAELKMWVGLCTTGSAVTMAVFAPIWGRLADSYGRKLMLLRAMFGAGVAVVLVGFAWNPTQLFVLRAIQGILSGTVAAATVLVATTAPEKEAGYALGMLQTAIFIGASIGPMIGGVIADLFGYRITFFVTAVFLFAAGAIIMKFVKEEFIPVRLEGSILRSLIPDFSPLRKSRELIILVFSAGILQAANQVSSPILPLFVQSMDETNTLVASTTGVILGAAALASALSAAFIGKASYRIGYRLTLLMCMFGAGFCAVPQALSATPVQLLIFRVCGGIFLGGAMPSINAMIAVRADKGKQGSIYGITSSFNSAGAALGPAIGSAIALSMGYSATFFGTSFILLTAGTAIALFTRVRHKK